MNDEKTSRRHSSAESLISVVLPVYNEERILPLLAAQLTRLLQLKEYDYEIIFVNDGSRDQSGRVLDELAESSSRIRVLAFFAEFRAPGGRSGRAGPCPGRRRGNYGFRPARRPRGDRGDDRALARRL